MVRDWKTTSHYKGLSFSTQQAYSTALKNLSDLMPTDISLISKRDLYDAGMKLHNRSASLALYKAVVKGVWGHAFAQGLVEDIPSIPIKGSKPVKREAFDETLLKEELKYPNSTLVTRAMYVALHTAQRIVDILNLKWSDYDGRSLTFVQKKTGTKVVVPCSRGLKRLLESMEKRGEHVIHNGGKSVSYPMFYAQYRKAFPKGKYPPFHAIRHTAASKIASMGASPYEIRSITGHRNLSSVQRYTDSADLSRAAKKIMDDYE